MHEHAVQFFGSERAGLTANVSGFLVDGLRQGGGALVVAPPALRDALRLQIGSTNIVYLDDDETLAQILGPDGVPDPVRFEAVIGTRARRLSARYGTFRAYGEMVSLLWARGASEAALQLEALWNGAMKKVPFDLFCGYAIDVLADDFSSAAVRPLIEAHTRVATSVEPEKMFRTTAEAMR